MKTQKPKVLGPDEIEAGPKKQLFASILLEPGEHTLEEVKHSGCNRKYHYDIPQESESMRRGREAHEALERRLTETVPPPCPCFMGCSECS